MKNIGGFFEKFNSKMAKEVQKTSVIIEAIKKHTGIVLGMKDIALSNGILRVRATSLQKNEMYMKKERILKEIQEKLPSPKVFDIR